MATRLETRRNEASGEAELWIIGVEEHKVLKGWESFSGWMWFATELNASGYHFGYVQGMHDEWGSFSEHELKDMGHYIWEIKECDLPFAGRR